MAKATIEKSPTAAKKIIIALTSPDILGVGAVGTVIVWLVGVPFWNSVAGRFASEEASFPALLISWIATVIFALLLIILVRSKRLFTFLVAAFVVAWLIWSGIIQNYSQLPWWNLFNANLPTPQFIVNRIAKLFILLLGSWALVSLHRFRSVRQELQKNGASVGDLYETSVFSTVILVGSAILIGSVLYLLLIIL